MSRQALGGARVRRWILILSPIGMIALCHAMQRLAGALLGVWAWLPTMLVFWSLITLLIASGEGGNPVGTWLGPPRGKRLWSALAVAVGLLSLGEFLSGWRTLGSPSMFALWLGFGLINPWFEESYWRGALIDATSNWASGLGVVYSTLCFALSHPLIWGVHSVALRHPAALVGLGIAGAVWGVTYHRTGSLRWTIAGHSLSNLLGLSVPVLLNAHVPAALR
jgi:membrane protease YdiL (CAAX protease family)